MSDAVAPFVEGIGVAIHAVSRFLWRSWEVHVLRHLIQDAQQLYDQRESRSSIHRNKERFAAWLLRYVDKVPLVAAVTMRAGLRLWIIGIMQG